MRAILIGFKISAAFFILMLLLLSPLNLWAQTARYGPSTINFILAVVAHSPKKENSQFFAVKDRAVLKSGDSIKFFLQPKSVVYFYLFHQSSSGELSLLHPKDLGKAQAQSGELLYVPEGSLWFELDSMTGHETFFLLVSKDKLIKLENLYSENNKLRDRLDVSASSQVIMQEIFRLKQQSKVLSKPAEKPYLSGGRLRDIKKHNSNGFSDIAMFAQEITAQGIYNQTFLIEHQE